jgi:sigma-B regulation protein RsbU (phosphoserine phosphatase)
LIAVVLAAVVFFVTAYALFCYGLWIDLFYPILFIAVLYLGLTLYRFIVERHKRLLLENELKVARRIQRSFLPEEPPEKEGLKIAASMNPAEEVGGDLYDFLDIDEKKIGVMVGDVSGKGVPAALFMAKTVSEFKSWARSGEEPSKVLANLNDQISTTSKSGLFVTISFADINMQNRKLILASAGHLPVILARKDQEEPLAISVEEGMPIGLVPGAGFGTKEVDLKQGDVIAFYSDGVTEAMNPKREEFGEKRLKDTIRQVKDLEPQAIIEEIHRRIKKFAGHAPQHDDITIIIVKVS